MNYSLRWLHVVCQLCWNADQGSVRVKELCRSDRLSGIMGLLLLWSWEMYWDRKGRSLYGEGVPAPVSLHMHIPARCAGGIREKTEEMIFPVPEQRCQTDACWDRSHTYHAQKWTHLGSNSVCVNTYVFLSDRWVCHVYVSVQRTREYLPSLSISLGCTMSVCFMSCSRCHRRGQEVTST